MVLCSTVALVLPYLSFKDPPSTALCVGSPVLVLCTWAPLQGLGSQSSPTHPQHWNLFVFSLFGMEGKGSFEMKPTLTPTPYAALLPREK